MVAKTGLGDGPTKLCAMAGLAKSLSLDGLLHLSYESLLDFSDRQVRKRVSFESLKSSFLPQIMARYIIQQHDTSCSIFLKW